MLSRRDRTDPLALEVNMRGDQSLPMAFDLTIDSVTGGFMGGSETDGDCTFDRDRKAGTIHCTNVQAIWGEYPVGSGNKLTAIYTVDIEIR
jgi:hypothetical protein